MTVRFSQSSSHKKKTKLTVNISSLVFRTVKTIHFGVSAARAPREPQAISGSVVVVKGSRTSTVADGVVQPGVGFKGIPVLLIAKLVM